MQKSLSRQLTMIDTLVANGREEFTFDEARAALGVSTPATANALRQLATKGFVDRLTRGHYAIRPLGSLGTAAVTNDLSLAVGAAFEGREHRIAYLSALSELGLVSHPVRFVFVACTRQVRFTKVGSWPLRSVVEKPQTIHLEAEAVGRSWQSTLERALLESALRVDLTGSVERLAEALAAGSRDANPIRITRLAVALGSRGRAAERRLASLAKALNLPILLETNVDRRQPFIRLDPRDERVEWTDDEYRVAWNTSVIELRATVKN